MARSGGGICRLLPHSLVSGRDVTDVLFQMSPILHARDDGGDLHEVPEQLSATLHVLLSDLFTNEFDDIFFE